MPPKALLLGLLAALTLPAQNPNSRWWSWPENPDPRAAERGKTHFIRACASCHGDKATGTTDGPNLIRSAAVRKDADGFALANLIRDGIPAKGMPAYPVDQPQLQDLIAFLRWTVQKYDRVSPGPPPENYPVDRLLIGDADAGKAFFNGAGGCSGCHSISGDLAGIGKKYPPVFLQSRFLMPRATKPKTATVTLASGEKVTGELRTLNNYDVILRDAQGKTLTFAAPDVKVDVSDPLAAHLNLLPKYTDADVHNMFTYLWSIQ